MKPIRILQVLTIMNRGGAEAMVMNYYRHMDRSKVQFDFLLHRQERGAYDDEIEQLGGKIYRLKNISFTNLIAYRNQLNEFFKTHQEYKIVHSHLNALSVFVLKSAKKNNIPVRIAHSHTSLYHLNLNPFSKERHGFNFIFKFFVQNIVKLKISNYANYYFACGEKAGKWLFGKKTFLKTQIINNAINTIDFIYNFDKSVLIKEKLNINNTLVVGHVGNFVPEKNHKFLLHVFQEVKKTNTNSKLMLIGGGNKEELELLAKEKQIEKDILFLGVRDDIPELLMAMDIFLFPSTNEGLPVTLIEAQASGLKILASDGVSKELNITGLVDFISLNLSPKLWAEQLLNSLNYKRDNTQKNIIDANYDILENANKLQTFYLQKN